MVILMLCYNVIIVMRVETDPTISAFKFEVLRSAYMGVYTVYNIRPCAKYTIICIWYSICTGSVFEQAVHVYQLIWVLGLS